MSIFTVQLNESEGCAPVVTYRFDGIDFESADHQLSRLLTHTDDEHSDGIFVEDGYVDFHRSSMRVDVLFDRPLPDVREDPEGWVVAVAHRVKMVRSAFDRERVSPEVN